MIRLTIFLILVGSFGVLRAQTMAEKVTQYIEVFLEEHQTFVSVSDLQGTVWKSKDAMGLRMLSLKTNGRYKIRSEGFQANSGQEKGKWFVNNQFIVLEQGKAKVPIYVLRNPEQIVLVDDDQIDVLKQLLTEASYKDGQLKPYSYEEIFTFLNGFIKTE